MDPKTEAMLNRVQDIYCAKDLNTEEKGMFGLKFVKHFQNLEEIGRDELFNFKVGKDLADHHGIITRPSKNLTVLNIGNHSSGKSSFINWYVGEKVQSTGIAIETSHFTMIKHGKKDIELKSEGTMAMYPFLREIMNKSQKEVYGKFFANLTTKVCSKKSKNFEYIDFIDTPGLTDGSTKYGCDIIEMMKWVANFVDLTLVFLDPIGQALCTKTLDMIEYLSKTHSSKTLICLTKIDQINPEDFNKLGMQIYSSIVSRTHEIHLDIMPISIISDYKSTNNKLSVVLDALESGFKGKSIRNVEIMTNDCRYIIDYSEKLLKLNQERISMSKVAKFLKFNFLLLSLILLFTFTQVSLKLEIIPIPAFNINSTYILFSGLLCFLLSEVASRYIKQTLSSTQIQKINTWLSYCSSSISVGEQISQEYFNN